MSTKISDDLIQRTIAFHGHECPGLAIGIRASELALERLGPKEAADLVAVVETDMCGVDAVQFLTGCTFGTGKLIHRDYGKMAFSFYDRKTGRGFRAVLRPEFQGEMGAQLRSIREKVINGSATEEERARSESLRDAVREKTMSADLGEIFSITELQSPAPRPPRVLQSLQCESCGEMTMESRTRRFGGKTHCIPCFEKIEQKT